MRERRNLLMAKKVDRLLLQLRATLLPGEPISLLRIFKSLPGSLIPGEMILFAV